MSTAVHLHDDDLSGPRLSSLTLGCPRQVWYQATDAPKRPPTPDEQRLWDRGHVVSNTFRWKITGELREDGHAPRPELEIPWPVEAPIGVGHADIYVPRHKRIVELTSTKGAKLQPHKALQAAAYAINHPPAEEAYVCAIDPASFEDRWYPIDVEGLRPQVEALQDELVAGLESGEPPARRCKRPSDAAGFFCPYADTCFEGWEPAGDALLDADAVSLVEILRREELAVADVRRELRQVEAERDETRRLLEPVLPVGEPVDAGGVEVRLTPVESRSFSLSQYLSAGHSLTAEMEAFTRSSSYTLWTIQEAKS